MAFADLTAYTNILKTFYLPAIRDQLNNDMILSKRVERDTESVSGKNATIAVQKGRSKGIGARSDGAALPVADAQKYDNLIVPTRYNYGRIRITGPTIAATRDSRGAYANALDNEITGMTQTLKKNINRQYWGCGYGIIGTHSATNSTKSYDWCKSYLAPANGGVGGFGSTFGAKYLYADATTPFGTNVNAYVVSAGTSATVDAIDTTVLTSQVNVKTITDTATGFDVVKVQADPSVSEADGTFYTLFGSGPSGTSALTRREMMGLRGIVTDTDIDDILTDGSSTGTTTPDPLQNIAIASNSWWKAAVFKHVGGRYTAQRALTIDLMEQAYDAPWEKRGEHPTAVYSTTSLRRKYFDLAVADRRLVNTMTLDGGFTALEFNSIPFAVDTDAIDGEIYFPNESHLKIYQMADFDWMDRHGAILFPVPGFDAYEAVLFRYAEFGTDARNSHAVLADVAYTKAVY